MPMKQAEKIRFLFVVSPCSSLPPGILILLLSILGKSNLLSMGSNGTRLDITDTKKIGPDGRRRTWTGTDADRTGAYNTRED